VQKHALGGLRVLNLSSTLGGAMVGQFFADFGADVVMVEPKGGSPLRTQAGWPVWARGSQSLEASLDDPAVKALALRADVLIDTFRPGVLERHGLGHEQLAKDNPRLVTTSITGFGRKGPLSKLKGYEGIVMAKVGAHDQFSALVKRPGPGFATVPNCTASAAELAISGAMVALYERETSGLGQRVETSMIQALAAHDTWNWMVSHWARKYPEAYTAAPVINTQRRVPNSWLSYGLLQGLSKDGRWMQFSQATPKLFKAFLEVTGLDDPEWNDAWEDEDLDRREAFWERLLGAVRSKTLAEWQEAFDANPNVFAEVFRSGTELLHHPQMLHDDQIATIEVAGLGPVRQAKPFVRLSKTPGQVKPPPALNEHGAALRAEAEQPAPKIEAPAEAPSGLPLAGVTIVELGSFYAAPFGITVLTDLGARVLKIEPLDGDPIRFQLAMPEIGGVKVTQGKESVAVDIGTPEGLEIVRTFLKSADLVLQSFRAGVAKRLGLDEASVREINPDVVYHEAPGFGTGGPYGHRPAYAPTIGAGSGMSRRNVGPAVPERADLSLDETKDGAIRMGAGSLSVAHADGFASLGVACGQTLGLLARARGAGGQGVVTTMLSTMSQILSEDMVEYEGRPSAPTADSGLHGFGPLYRLYETKSGWVFLAVTTEREWASLKRAAPGMGLDDARFADAAARKASADALVQTLGAVFMTRTAAQWEAALTEADVACVEAVKGPCQDVLMAPGGLAIELGMTCEVDHPLFGEHQRLTSVMQFSRSATQAGAGAMIGQHTEKALKDYGYSDAQIAALAEKGVILLG
jgi:crotonobetainyl-CoA:carnitine CoA-transferase CaiB-like acyl-CoA transferase